MTLYDDRHFHYIKKSVEDIIQFPELWRNRLQKSQSLKSAHIVLAFERHVCIAKRGKKLENYDLLKCLQIIYYSKAAIKTNNFQKVLTKSKQN